MNSSSVQTNPEDVFPLVYQHKPKPSLALRLRVLSAIDYAQGNSIRERIKNVAERSFFDNEVNCEYQFTWRTISTWFYRFKKNGITTLDNHTRSDKHCYRKVKLNELSEAIHEILPNLSFNKTGIIPKSTVYRQLIQKNLLFGWLMKLINNKPQPS